MEDQGHNGKQQQKVYESSGDMKYGKTGDPRNQQNYKQHSPNTHEMPPVTPLLIKREMKRPPYGTGRIHSAQSI
jgi:hypothetical protein